MATKDETTDFAFPEFLFSDLIECFESNELEFIAHALDTFAAARDISAKDRSFLLKYCRVFFAEVLLRKIKNVSK